MSPATYEGNEALCFVSPCEHGAVVSTSYPDLLESCGCAALAAAAAGHAVSSAPDVASTADPWQVLGRLPVTSRQVLWVKGVVDSQDGFSFGCLSSWVQHVSDLLSSASASPTARALRS